VFGEECVVLSVGQADSGIIKHPIVKPDPLPNTQLFDTYWWLPPLLVFAALFKSARFKGFIGEAMVNMAARLFLNKNDNHLTKNATIPFEVVRPGLLK